MNECYGIALFVGGVAVVAILVWIGYGLKRMADIMDERLQQELGD